MATSQPSICGGVFDPIEHESEVQMFARAPQHVDVEVLMIMHFHLSDLQMLLTLPSRMHLPSVVYGYIATNYIYHMPCVLGQDMLMVKCKT